MSDAFFSLLFHFEVDSRRFKVHSLVSGVGAFIVSAPFQSLDTLVAMTTLIICIFVIGSNGSLVLCGTTSASYLICGSVCRINSLHHQVFNSVVREEESLLPVVLSVDEVSDTEQRGVTTHLSEVTS